MSWITFHDGHSDVYGAARKRAGEAGNGTHFVCAQSCVVASDRERKSFWHCKSIRALVKVVPLRAPDRGDEHRLGLLCRQIIVPDDFDQAGKVFLADSQRGV